MAEKNENSVGGMIKLGLILVCYAVASCAVLAVVNLFTAPKIEQNKKEAADKAMNSIISGCEFIPVSDFDKCENSQIVISSFYLAKDENGVLGGICQVAGPTYDKSKIIVGVLNDGTVKGVQFLENTDSPGFGLKASDPNWTIPEGCDNAGKTFYGQFEGKNCAEGFVIVKEADGVKETFDAISGATITSKGAGELINAGCKSLMAFLSDAEKVKNALAAAVDAENDSENVPVSVSVDAENVAENDGSVPEMESEKLNVEGGSDE